MVFNVHRNHKVYQGQEKGRKGLWSWGTGTIIYLSLHCHHQNDSRIKMGSDKSHFNCFLNCEGQSHKTVSTITCKTNRLIYEGGSDLTPKQRLMAQRAYQTEDTVVPPPSLQQHIVQELWESRGGRPGLSVITSLPVSVDVKLYWTMLRHWSQLVPNMSSEDIKHHFIFSSGVRWGGWQSSNRPVSGPLFHTHRSTCEAARGRQAPTPWLCRRAMFEGSLSPGLRPGRSQVSSPGRWPSPWWPLRCLMDRLL